MLTDSLGAWGLLVSEGQGLGATVRESKGGLCTSQHQTCCMASEAFSAFLPSVLS